MINVATQGWVLLKYKPAVWFFEVPLLWHKVFVITVSLLYDSGTPDDTVMLLDLLVGSTLFMCVVALARPELHVIVVDRRYFQLGPGLVLRRLFLVLVTKPYVDKAGQTGLTGADKVEILALVCLLMVYAVCYWCWSITEADPATNRPLTAIEDAGTTVSHLCAP